MSTPSARTLRYVAIGDSIPRGYRFRVPRLHRTDQCDIRLMGIPLRWFDHPEDGYPARLRGLLGERLGRPVELDASMTCSGAGTYTWWHDGPSRSLAAAMTSRPDLVTVTLGANDLLRRWIAYVPVRHAIRLVSARPATWADRVTDRLAPPIDAALRDAQEVERRLGEMLRWLRSRLACPIGVTTYYGGRCSVTFSERFVRPLNAAIRAAAGSAEAITVVDLDEVFLDAGVPYRKVLDIADGIHPTPVGHRLIASGVAAAMTPRLS